MILQRQHRNETRNGRLRRLQIGTRSWALQVAPEAIGLRKSEAKNSQPGWGPQGPRWLVG